MRWMDEATLFLDVNVPMYAAGRAHRYQAACAWIMGEVAHGRLAVVIDSEIVQEILYRFGALGQWTVGAQMARSVLDLVPRVLPVTAADARAAVALFATYGPQGVKARDVVHAAVMRNHGLTRIVSADTHFDRIAGIKRLDPLDLYAAR